MQNRIWSEASTSGAITPKVDPTSLHTAWEPYRLLNSTARKKIDPNGNLPTETFLQSLSIPPNVASERITSKYLQLEPPKGKMTEKRRIELEKKALMTEARKIKRVKEGECGLIGRRKRASLMNNEMKKGLITSVRYDAVLPMHSLWLGYMSELLSLPLVIPTSTSTSSTSTLSPSTSTLTTSSLVHTFPSKIPTSTEATGYKEQNINAANIHAKLVKAEFVGCIFTVKRAKNPSLVALTGLVLQETLGTFKIVTTSSKIKILPKKGSIFTFNLPLKIPASAQENSSATILSRELSMDIFGDSFAYRSSERVGKKWKVGGGGGLIDL